MSKHRKNLVFVIREGLRKEEVFIFPFRPDVSAAPWVLLEAAVEALQEACLIHRQMDDWGLRLPPEVTPLRRLASLTQSLLARATGAPVRVLLLSELQRWCEREGVELKMGPAEEAAANQTIARREEESYAPWLSLKTLHRVFETMQAPQPQPPTAAPRSRPRRRDAAWAS